MPLPRRALLAAAPALALAACFGRPGASQVAQDAKLIVTSITPIAHGIGDYGVTPAVAAEVRESLATATSEASALALQGTPTLLDTQEFLVAAQSLLQTLDAVAGLPPSATGVIDAATALLPVFAAVVSARVVVRPKMSPDQARLILRGTGDVARPSPTEAAPAPAIQPPRRQATNPTVAPPPAALGPGMSRFHVSASDDDGRVSFEFRDRGEVIEQGEVANFRALDARFEAFKKQRLQQAP